MMLICELIVLGVQLGGGGDGEEEEEEGDILPPGRRFKILAVGRRYFPRFNASARETQFRILPPEPGYDHLPWLEGAVRDVLTHLTDSCRGHDYVGITLRVPSLQTPAWLSFRQAREISFDDVWGLFNSILQSAREFQIESGMCEMSTCVVSGVEGSGRVALTHETISKKSILTINNTDNLCLPRSLVAARAHAERGDLRSGEFNKNWRRISDGRRDTQRSAALELVHRSGVKIPARGCGLRETHQFQKSLANEGIAIVVYEFLTFGKRIAALYDGHQSVISATSAIKHTLYILYYQQSNHYQTILNLTAALGSRGFCTLCNVTYTLAIEHRCSRQCPRCKSAECAGDEENIRYCRDCNGRFFENACLAQHKKPNSARLRGGWT